MSFRLAASLVAAVCAILFLVLLITPQLYAPTYGVAADTGVQFITRRASPMFLGLAIFLWMARDTEPGRFRDAAAFSTAAVFIGVAVTGVVAWGLGIATSSILVAAGLEVLMAAILLISRNK